MFSEETVVYGQANDGTERPRAAPRRYRIQNERSSLLVVRSIDLRTILGPLLLEWNYEIAVIPLAVRSARLTDEVSPAVRRLPALNDDGGEYAKHKLE